MGVETILTCDLCGNKIDHCQRSYKIPSTWWWRGMREKGSIDYICGECFSFIRELRANEITAFRIIWDIYKNMCISDMNEFKEKLVKLAKKTDRYYKERY